jgi:hypothetical protein
VTRHLHIVPVPRRGFSLPSRADYYGYRWAFTFARWLVFVGYIDLPEGDDEVTF